MEYKFDDAKLEDGCILFADIKGFSRLNKPQFRRYLQNVLQPIGKILTRHHCEQPANTWGDGVMAFFRSPTEALDCALEIRDRFRITKWEENEELPKLEIRIALHAGEVYTGINPIRNQRDYIGTEVNRAARLEPVTKPNHVYVTNDFRSRCTTRDDVDFNSLGEVDLPKNFGTEEIYVVTRKNWDAPPQKVVQDKDIEADTEAFVKYVKSSHLGRRLAVRETAKTIIANYCVRKPLWKEDDVVFLESGTLPIFMAFDCYRQRGAGPRPAYLITNNLACSIIAVMERSPGNEAQPYFPEDRPINVSVLGGRVLDDYAGTIPEDLLTDDAGESGGPPIWGSEDVFAYLKSKKVNDVIMMVTKLTSGEGPYAASPHMRRYKKLLLRYVSGNNARLTICGEADKLVEGYGLPADQEQLAPADAHRYWPDVLRERKVTVISALSPNLPRAKETQVKEEIMKLRAAGASAVLLDLEGNEILLRS